MEDRAWSRWFWNVVKGSASMARALKFYTDYGRREKETHTLISSDNLLRLIEPPILYVVRFCLSRIFFFDIFLEGD